MSRNPKQYDSRGSTQANSVSIKLGFKVHQTEKSKCESIKYLQILFSSRLQSSSFSMGLQQGSGVSVGALHGDGESSLTTLGNKKKDKD